MRLSNESKQKAEGNKDDADATEKNSSNTNNSNVNNNNNSAQSSSSSTAQKDDFYYPHVFPSASSTTASSSAPASSSSSGRSDRPELHRALAPAFLKSYKSSHHAAKLCVNCVCGALCIFAS